LKKKLPFSQAAKPIPSLKTAEKLSIYNIIAEWLLCWVTQSFGKNAYVVEIAPTLMSALNITVLKKFADKFVKFLCHHVARNITLQALVINVFLCSDQVNFSNLSPTMPRNQATNTIFKWIYVMLCAVLSQCAPERHNNTATKAPSRQMRTKPATYRSASTSYDSPLFASCILITLICTPILYVSVVPYMHQHQRHQHTDSFTPLIPIETNSRTVIPTIFTPFVPPEPLTACTNGTYVIPAVHKMYLKHSWKRNKHSTYHKFNYNINFCNLSVIHGLSTDTHLREENVSTAVDRGPAIQRHTTRGNTHSSPMSKSKLMFLDNFAQPRPCTQSNAHGKMGCRTFSLMWHGILLCRHL
jgi:hypothetical protein